MPCQYVKQFPPKSGEEDDQEGGDEDQDDASGFPDIVLAGFGLGRETLRGRRGRARGVRSIGGWQAMPRFGLMFSNYRAVKSARKRNPPGSLEEENPQVIQELISLRIGQGAQGFEKTPVVDGANLIHEDIGGFFEAGGFGGQMDPENLGLWDDVAGDRANQGAGVCAV